MWQGIPEACDTEAILHRYDLRGRQEDNWMDQHQEYIQRWNSRCDHIANAEAFSEFYIEIVFSKHDLRILH